MNELRCELRDISGRLIDASSFPLTRAMRFRRSTEAEEVHLRRRDGSEIWLSITAAPVCLGNGTQLGGVLVVQDIYTGTRERERLLEVVRELTSMVPGTSPASHQHIS
jgi:PAS domain S-box-containing protein